jgi:ParB family transcriptional regulator, chromosome partitioning protein
MANEEIVKINPNLLQPNPVQVRGEITPKSINDLVMSIKQHGILEPLVVAKTPAGYQIISGERRWKAAKVLGLDTVPVIIKSVGPKEMVEMTLVDDVQREGLSALDRAKAFQRMKEEFGIPVAEIAEKIGKSVPYVVNTMKLLSLPDALKDGLLSGLITEGHARALGGIGDTRYMVEAYKMVLKEQASVRRAEEIARRIKKNTRKLNASDGRESLASIQLARSELDQIGKRIANSMPGGEAGIEITQSKMRASIKISVDGTPKETNLFISELLKKLED